MSLIEIGNVGTAIARTSCACRRVGRARGEARAGTDRRAGGILSKPKPPKKRGPGRPPLGAAARKRIVALKVSDAELHKLRGQAEGAGVSVSEWVRRLAGLS